MKFIIIVYIIVYFVSVSMGFIGSISLDSRDLILVGIVSLILRDNMGSFFDSDVILQYKLENGGLYKCCEFINLNNNLKINGVLGFFLFCGWPLLVFLLLFLSFLPEYCYYFQMTANNNDHYGAGREGEEV